jgi:hypothetical protein
MRLRRRAGETERRRKRVSRREGEWESAYARIHHKISGYGRFSIGVSEYRCKQMQIKYRLNEKFTMINDSVTND